MNTINVNTNPFGDGDCWNDIFEKLYNDLKAVVGRSLAATTASTVTLIFNTAHELGYKLVKA